MPSQSPKTQPPLSRRTVLKMAGVGAGAAAILSHPLGLGMARAATARSLFEPVQLGSLSLKNRIIRASTSMEMAGPDGSPTPELLQVYADLAKGGAAMLVTGLAWVLPNDQNFHAALGLHSQEQLSAFEDLADVIREHGSTSCLQIGLAGSVGGYKVGERDIWGPSAVAHPFTKVTPKAMTTEDIQTLIEALATASARAKEAGFDAIQLHYCHNFGLQQFLAPYFNKRTDAYGGPIENRARLHFEILEAVRKAVGPDYPVLAKIHGHDYLEKDGMTMEEGLYLAEGLAERGVTALEVSGGNLMRGPEYLPIRPEILDDPSLQSYFAKDAATLDKAVDVPLILTGGNRDTGQMRQVLDDIPDVVAFGLSRTLLSEPDLPNTWAKDPNAAPQCVACNWCLGQYGSQPTACVLNI